LTQKKVLDGLKDSCPILQVILAHMTQKYCIQNFKDIARRN